MDLIKSKLCKVLLDGYFQLLSVGLWAVPAQNVVVMMVPAAGSVRFARKQALSFRAALDATIAQLPAPPA